MERVFTGVEVRASGREIVGLGLPYGEISPSHLERFEAGGAEIAPAAYLDLEHDPLKVVAYIGGGLTIEDTVNGMMIRAVAPPTPAGDVALSGIADGSRSGLSVEFKALDETRDEGIRVVTRYQVAGFGLVSAASYTTAGVTEVRAPRRRVLWL